MAHLRTFIARSATEMDRLARLWEELLNQQPHGLFQRFSWNRLAAQMFSDRLAPYVVCVESDRGAAIIPAAVNLQDDRIELLGETLFDYRDVLHSGDEEILLQAWRELTALDKPLHVAAVDQVACRRNWSGWSLTPFANAPQVDRRIINQDEFRLAHPRLGRQMRRLQKLGVELRIYSGDDSGIVRRLYESKRSHFTASANTNLFLDLQRCEFMVRAAKLEGRACGIYLLEEGDDLVAGLVTFRDGGIRRFYTTYLNPQWSHYSPGQALLYEATALSLGDGLTCDYMTGEYSYKLRLANSSRQLFRIEVSSRVLAAIVGRVSIPAA
jgi:CelD/BcsL family acetyltransferase involved in cellulose biosynthesis